MCNTMCSSHIYIRAGLLMSGGGCPVGGVGVMGCGGEGGGDSRTGRRAMPGTGLCTPSLSLPRRT